MTDQPSPRGSRPRTLLITAIVVAGLAAVITGTVAAGAAAPSASSSRAAATAAGAPGSTEPGPSASAFPAPPVRSASAPTPQPTRSSELGSAESIRKQLTIEVTRVEAVDGAAKLPGEIAGPAVRFTVVITNSTGKRVDLSNAVVNASAGADRSPATALSSPGGQPFPASVAAGDDATGVFVFSIPTSQRRLVEVTVDTAVQNPVIAFTGSAPR